MNWLKKRWEITQNWQLLYPVLIIIGLGYSCFKLSSLFGFNSLVWTIIGAIILFAIILQLMLKLFTFLEKRWKVAQRWRVIRIFLVFAITGSLSLLVTEPLFEAIGMIKENFGSHFLSISFFYVLKFILILPIYKIMLVFFGWLLGEFKFFLNFTIKLANRLGLKKITEKIAAKQ